MKYIKAADIVILILNISVVKISSGSPGSRQLGFAFFDSDPLKGLYFS